MRVDIVTSVHVQEARWAANGKQFKKASLNTDTCQKRKFIDHISMTGGLD